MKGQTKVIIGRRGQRSIQETISDSEIRVYTPEGWAEEVRKRQQVVEEPKEPIKVVEPVEKKVKEVKEVKKPAKKLAGNTIKKVSKK